MDKDIIEKTLDKMLDAIDPHEVVYVLKRVIRGNDELIKKTIKVVEDILSNVNPEDIAEELFYELNNIEVEYLWANSGKTRYGYVDPNDKAWEMFEEVLEPYMDKMKKSKELNMQLETKNYCIGILQGLQRYDQLSSSEFADWVIDAPSEYMNMVLAEGEKGNPNPEDLEEVKLYGK